MMLMDSSGRFGFDFLPPVKPKILGDHFITYLVIGATGKQGGAVIRSMRMLETTYRHEIRALVRDLDSEKAKYLSKDGIILVKGNLLDKESLLRAFVDVDRIFMITVPELSKGCKAEEVQGKLIIEAAIESNVSFVVFSSILSPPSDFSKTPHFESKFRIETQLITSGIPHCILKPAFFMDNLNGPGPGADALIITQGNISFSASPDVKLPFIAVRDIGEVVAHALRNPTDYIGKSLELVGDVVSGNEIAQIFSKIRNGEDWKYSQKSLWFGGISAPDLEVMTRWVNDTSTSYDRSSHIKHMNMMTLEQYCLMKGYDTTEFPKKTSCSIM